MMTPVAFFFAGMLLLWAVVSGKAGAIWSAILSSGSTPTTGVQTPGP